MPNVMFLSFVDELYKIGALHAADGGIDKTAHAHAKFASSMLKLARDNPRMGWFGEQGGGQPLFASLKQRAMANNPMADKVIAQGEKATIADLQKFVQSNPELRAAMARSPLAKHMPESAMANVLLMSRKGNESAMDTARRVGIMGTPSQSDMLRQLNSPAQVGQSGGTAPTAAGLRPSAPAGLPHASTIPVTRPPVSTAGLSRANTVPTAGRPPAPTFGPPVPGPAPKPLRPPMQPPKPMPMATAVQAPTMAQRPAGLKPGGTLRTLGSKAFNTLGRVFKMAA